MDLLEKERATLLLQKKKIQTAVEYHTRINKIWKDKISDITAKINKKDRLIITKMEELDLVMKRLEETYILINTE